MKLRFKILIMCLGCTLLALILQTVLFQRTSSALIYNLSREESENSLQNMQKEIYQLIKHIENNLIEIYTEEELIHALKEQQDIEELRAAFYRKAYDIGNSQFETEDGVVSLYLYTPDHEIISTYRRAVTPKHNYPTDIYEDKENRNVQIVRDYAESDDAAMLISSYYNQYREKDILRFVLKLYYDSNRNKKIGYVVCDVDSKVFVSIMEKYRTDNTVCIWLQPDGDRPAASIGDQTERKQESVPGQELFQVQQNKYNLTAYSLMPQWVLEQNQRVLTTNLLMIAMLMLVISSGLTIVVSRSVTRPLDMLIGTIQKIRDGDAGLRAEVKNHDEIGELGKRFNEMLDRMEELMEQEKRAQLLLSQAEYKALQAQINPHFLYNTLDVMGSIAELHNCPEVSMLSHSLSNIFRYSLNMKDPYSTIAKEITHLKNYSYVMSVRMQDHVQYIYEIDEDTLQDKVPRISLQPLVENALNHGLRNKRGEKEIRITVKNQGATLLICVEDNGVGMDAEALNESLRNNDLNYVAQGTSIGLHNINARLKLLHGDAYGVWIESSIGKGTRVFMTIPREG